MKKIVEIRGAAVPLLRANIDTDQIIPSREITTVSKHGLGGGLFAGWRYLNTGAEEKIINPDFILNQPAFSKVRVLLAGDNFGCGSSREHAVWALADYGIKAVVAPSFGSIFYNNCIRNGLLPVRLSENILQALSEQIGEDSETNELCINLRDCSLTAANGDRYIFEIEPLNREMLMGGLDIIDMTLSYEDKIISYEIKDRETRPWVYLS